MAQDNSARGLLRASERSVARYRLKPWRRQLPACSYCGKPNFRQAKSCGRRACPGYVDTWLQDQRVRILHNLIEFGGQVVMITLTPPSMPWDRAHCAHRGPHKCSGTDGCRVDPTAAREWHQTTSKRLSLLHRSSYAAAKRKAKRPPLRIAYVPELQARGVIHWHIILSWNFEDRVATRAYVHAMHARAARYSYGFPDRKPVRSGAKGDEAGAAAAYLSKYLTKTDAKGLRELVVERVAPARPVFVSPRLTKTTRCTMRNLRRRRAAWVLWGPTSWTLPQVDLVWATLKAFPGAYVADEAGERYLWQRPPPVPVVAQRCASA